MDMVGGIPTPLKNMKVNWDDYPNQINDRMVKYVEITSNMSNMLTCSSA